MTTDDLRSRRRTLMAQRQDLLALRAKGEGDSLALFVIEEELLDVKTQLRALSPKKRVGMRRTTNSACAADRQQFLAWTQANNADNTDSHAGMLDAMRQALEKLKPRQRAMLELWKSGHTLTDIAGRFGVRQSTVSRTIQRAKQRLQWSAEAVMRKEKLLSDRLDLSDPETARLVLRALTPVQAAYLYLYYSEWLSLREITNLTGTDASSVCRTIHRALRNIGKALCLDGGVWYLEHVDALDDLAYHVYCDMQQTDTIVPPAIKPAAARANNTQSRAKGRHAYGQATASACEVRVIDRCGERRRGRLLAALLDRNRNQAMRRQPVIRWLLGIFQRVCRRVQTNRIRGE